MDDRRGVVGFGDRLVGLVAVGVDFFPVEIPLALVFQVFQLSDDVTEGFDARCVGNRRVAAVGCLALQPNLLLADLCVGGVTSNYQTSAACISESSQEPLPELLAGLL